MNPDFRDMLIALSDESVEYLLVGAFALAAHGVPRSTGDIDIWIRASEENAARVWRALVRFGAPLDAVKQSDLGSEKVVFQMGLPPRRIDLLTSIDGVEFEEAWARRLEFEFEGVRVPTIGRDDLIQNKRAVARPQDLADVERLEQVKRR